MSADSVESFVRLLRKSPSGAVFNPWWQVDEENDIGSQAPAIRRKQLVAYLQDRLGKARLVVVGEALGYRGGHFTGIAMTSERILLERKPSVLSGITPQRTSKPEKFPRGFAEPTATIVWNSLLRLGLSPDRFVLWNAFPWHSLDPQRGMLSNRMPSKAERIVGIPVLEAFFVLFPCDKVVALGRIAAAQLEEMDVDARCVRHPASGGARLFRAQIGKIVAKSS